VEGFVEHWERPVLRLERRQMYLRMVKAAEHHRSGGDQRHRLFGTGSGSIG
jgi:hypothetical protein